MAILGKIPTIRDEVMRSRDTVLLRALFLSWVPSVALLSCVRIERGFVAERDRLPVRLEDVRLRHSGRLCLLDAGLLLRIFNGKQFASLCGPYRVEIYFCVAEISSVFPGVVKIQHRARIELTRLSLENTNSG
jgi:hypothetical protein